MKTTIDLQSGQGINLRLVDNESEMRAKPEAGDLQGLHQPLASDLVIVFSAQTSEP
jgi:hypothetical protein